MNRTCLGFPRSLGAITFAFAASAGCTASQDLGTRPDADAPVDSSMFLSPDTAGAFDADAGTTGLGDGPADTTVGDGDAGIGADGEAGAPDVSVGNVCSPDGSVVLDAGSAPSQLYVFTTSVALTGNLGGLAGADCTCQALAFAAGLPGAYKAWLSDSTTAAASRLTHGAVPYELVDGTLVASNWAQLRSGTLAHAIDKTEQGTTPPTGGNSFCGAGTVWTDTDYLGQIEDPALSCSDWTDPGANASMGRWQLANGGWTSGCFGTVCNESSAFYCIQQ